MRLPPAVGPGRARLPRTRLPLLRGARRAGEGRGLRVEVRGNARGTAPLRSPSAERSTRRGRRARLASGAHRRVTYVVAEAALTHICLASLGSQTVSFPFVGSLSVCECLSSAGLQILFFFFFFWLRRSQYFLKMSKADLSPFAARENVLYFLLLLGGWEG